MQLTTLRLEGDCQCLKINSPKNVGCVAVHFLVGTMYNLEANIKNEKKKLN